MPEIQDQELGAEESPPDATAVSLEGVRFTLFVDVEKYGRE